MNANVSLTLLSSLGLCGALAACEQKTGFEHFPEPVDAPLQVVTTLPEAPTRNAVLSGLENSLTVLARSESALPTCDLVPTRSGYVFLFNTRPREAVVMRVGAGGGYHVSAQHGEIVTPSELSGYLGDTGRRIYLDTGLQRLQLRTQHLTGFSIETLAITAPDAGIIHLFAAIPR